MSSQEINQESHTETPRIQKNIKKKRSSKKQYSTQHFMKEINETLESLPTKIQSDESNQFSCISELITQTLSQKLSESNLFKNRQVNTTKILNWVQKKSKVCQICHENKDQDQLAYCDPCEDVFHIYCVNLKRKPGPRWLCPECKIKKIEIENQEEQQSSLNITIILSQKCGRCNEKFENKLKENPKCLKCQKRFHKICFAKEDQKDDQFLCCFCVQQTVVNIQQNETLYKYFTTLSTSQQAQQTQQTQQTLVNEQIDLTQKQNQQSFLLPLMCSNELLQLECKQSLFFALASQNITFCDDLVYDRVQRTNNDSKLEHFLQPMIEPNYSIFQEFKKMSQEGNYGPLKVIYDNLQGFIVQAQDNISKGTLICEYAGEVYLYKEQVFCTNDSIMTLLKTARSSTTLVIIPEKFGNIAKFLSGVNNHRQYLKKKQNVQSIKFSIDGEARILLIASKNIRVGEILYYDYNAGGDNLYDTKSFV